MSRLRRRAIHHALLATLTALMLAVVYAGVPTDFVLRRWNLATAYAALALLGLALMIGPWHVLRGRTPPVSLDLRRDVGIWAGLVSLAHTVVGLQVHMQGKWWLYFVWPADQAHTLPLRSDGFGVANYTGLAATLIACMLLALSNDLSLARLGTARWKALQRWNYAGFVLIAVHGVIYQVMEKRVLPVAAVFALMLVVVVATQLAGWRHRRSSPNP